MFPGNSCSPDNCPLVSVQKTNVSHAFHWEAVTDLGGGGSSVGDQIQFKCIWTVDKMEVSSSMQAD